MTASVSAYSTRRDLVRLSPGPSRFVSPYLFELDDELPRVLPDSRAVSSESEITASSSAAFSSAFAVALGAANSVRALEERRACRTSPSGAPLQSNRSHRDHPRSPLAKSRESAGTTQPWKPTTDVGLRRAAAKQPHLRHACLGRLMPMQGMGCTAGFRRANAPRSTPDERARNVTRTPENTETRHGGGSRRAFTGFTVSSSRFLRPSLARSSSSRSCA